MASSKHLIGSLLALACGLSPALVFAQEINFNRDIRPVLAKNCFACHGPDEDHRESDLRLDDRASAVDSGAIEPGDPESSELISRINSTDDDVRMPPAETHPQLSVTDREKISQWIEQGADYQPHWAFVPLVKPELPAGTNNANVHPIDAFVLERLGDLNPSRSADGYTLVRRLYLDLIGLPPSREEAFAWAEKIGIEPSLSNLSQIEAYESLVDELLSSPRYGERWARPWLDLARYADTNGYEKDRPRSIWPYRDWVINALNDDMPYDQFSIEQLAGDMLPDASISSRVATGFHRNTMLNEEGGIDPLEYRFLALADRVATTGIVWMGLTTGCAQCHTHKYDPITHTDYYSMMAFFNNADEPDLLLADQERAESLKSARGKINEIEGRLLDKFNEDLAATSDYENWKLETAKSLTHWTPLRPTTATSNLPTLEIMGDDSIFSSGDVTKRDVYKLSFDKQALSELGDQPITALRIDAIPDDRLPDGGPGRTYFEGKTGEFFLSELSATVDGEPSKFASASVDSVNGKSVEQKQNAKRASEVFDGDGSSGWKSSQHTPCHLVVVLEEPIETNSVLALEMLFERHFPAALGRFKVSATSMPDAAATPLPESVEGLFRIAPTSWTDQQSRIVKLHWIRQQESAKEANKEIMGIESSVPAAKKTLVMQERSKPATRPTHRHHRGEYQSPRETVEPAILELFNDRQPEPVTNRLQFARWLTSSSNPLFARVAVNRAWRQFFGRGLVETDGDFGTQSSPPSHPELLDFLASSFVQRNQSMKQLHRLIVTSKTYQQSSTGNQSVQSDPANILLSRGPRFRIDGETIRDAMLKSSGLLSEKMFGPGVKPPQPKSVVAMSYGNPDWTVATGEDRYRRSIYTFAKRTAPFASYTVFDSPTGENCTARRNRSNTPLQALTLLNDEMYLEMARALAIKGLKSGEKVDQFIAYIFESVLSRPIEKFEADQLRTYYIDQLTRITKGDLDAATILGIDEDGTLTGIGESIDQADRKFVAALTLVARIVMNLDEAITKE